MEPAPETVVLIERIKSSPLPRLVLRPALQETPVAEPVTTRLTRAVAGRYKVERQLGAGPWPSWRWPTISGTTAGSRSRSCSPSSPLVGPERFLREIEIAAGLQHPHILGVYDSGEAAGLMYYVMPFVEGESLRDRLNRELRLPIERRFRSRWKSPMPWPSPTAGALSIGTSSRKIFSFPAGTRWWRISALPGR